MPSPQASPTKPLASRDVNTTAPSPSKIKAGNVPMDIKDKPRSMEYHRQVLQSRLEEDKSKQTYVSPSDTIMSPCTAKLSNYKSKHFMKAKPQSLFAKMESSKKSDDVVAEAMKEGKDGSP